MYSINLLINKGLLAGFLAVDYNGPCSGTWYLLDCAQAAGPPDDFTFSFGVLSQCVVGRGSTFASGCYVATSPIFIGFCDGLAEAAIVVKTRFRRQ